MAISDEDINIILRRINFSDEKITSLVQSAILRGTIVTPTGKDPANYAGGTNLCPNSDFSFSHLAATVAGTDPADATDPNNTLYRCFRQAVGADISTTGVRVSALEGSSYIPVWDKTYGIIALGATNIANNYDIAIQLTQNWAVPAQDWYVRIAIATMDANPVPDGLKLYAGLWRKEAGGTQGWIESSLLNATATKFYIPGATTVSYKVIAKTDSGVSIESQVLTVTDAPATFDEDNYLRISYEAISGFIEFYVYKQVGSTVYLIAHERNSTSLHAYDIGQVINVEPSGFPTADLSKPRAYAEVAIDAREITSAKTMNNLTLKIPAYDTTLLASEGTYLRIGLTGETASDRQIAIDTVWAGTSYNRWTVSPYDNFSSRPSAQITTGVGTGGSNGGDPPPTGGGSTCVATWMDLLIDADLMAWETLGDAGVGIEIESGAAKKNRVRTYIDGVVSQHYLVTFDSGLVVPASPSHIFIRSFQDGSGVTVDQLKVGDTIQGGDREGSKVIVVVSKKLVTSMIPVRAVKVLPGNNLYYAVGNRHTDEYVYCHNRKADYEYTEAVV